MSAHPVAVFFLARQRMDELAAAKAEAEEAVALYQSACENLSRLRDNALLCVARHAALAGVPATTVIYPVPPELDVSDGIEVILQDAKARGAALRKSTRAVRWVDEGEEPSPRDVRALAQPARLPSMSTLTTLTHCRSTRQ